MLRKNTVNKKGNNGLKIYINLVKILISSLMMDLKKILY